MAQGNYSHIEIPADNVDRAVGFYKSVFGWKFETIPGFEGYELYQTAAGREGIGGGIGKRGQTAGKEIRNYIDVDSVDERRLYELAIRDKRTGLCRHDYFQDRLQDNNAAQGQSATATFTWEAQNT